jgi:hypothetical protein
VLIRHRDVIIGAANRHRLPFIGFDVFATAGGLMTYFADATAYIDRILKGEIRPSCRCKRGTSCGSTSRQPKRSAPPTPLARVDEVIE